MTREYVQILSSNEGRNLQIPPKVTLNKDNVTDMQKILYEVITITREIWKFPLTSLI